jgi:hypothetical protein
VAKIKYNVKGVESRSGNMEPIPKGTYECEVETCVAAKPKDKDERIEVVYVVCDGDYKGRKLFDYINLESEAAAWKLRQFLETFGLVTDKKEAGDFDPEKLVGEKLMVRVTHQVDKRPDHEGEVQSRVGGTFAAGESDEDDEDLDGESGETKGEDDEQTVDLDELDRAELKKFIKDEELEIKVLKSMSDDDVRKVIAEQLSDDEDDDDDDDDEDEDDDDETVDLDELDRAGLKALIKSEGLDIKVLKKHTDDDVRKLIAEAMGEDGDDDDDDDEDVDYDDLDVEQLRTTCKERGLSEKGSKKILVARLKKDDEQSKKDGDPF